MYNRYIPTASGSYVRKRVDEPVAARRESPPAASSSAPATPAAQLEDPCPSEFPGEIPCPKPGLLQRLLPQNLEMADLLILLILVLILLDSDEQSDTLSIVLTVAAFLILK